MKPSCVSSIYVILAKIVCIFPSFCLQNMKPPSNEEVRCKTIEENNKMIDAFLKTKQKRLYALKLHQLSQSIYEFYSSISKPSSMSNILSIWFYSFMKITYDISFPLFQQLFEFMYFFQSNSLAILFIISTKT